MRWSGPEKPEKLGLTGKQHPRLQRGVVCSWGMGVAYSRAGPEAGAWPGELQPASSIPDQRTGDRQAPPTPTRPPPRAAWMEGGPQYEAVWYKEVSSQQDLMAYQGSQMTIRSGKCGMEKRRSWGAGQGADPREGVPASDPLLSAALFQVRVSRVCPEF